MVWLQIKGIITFLRPEEQSPYYNDYSLMIIFITNSPRALPVREMARLQSFDDSFVFQGKRSTGGNKENSEIPQFTLVGNAVPSIIGKSDC